MASPAKTSSAVVYSVALHAVIVLAFALDVDLWRTRPAAPAQPEAIKASVVDAAAFEQARQAQDAAAERARQAELERQREEQAEREAELERQREQQEAERQAELERQREEEAERQAELERQRQEEAEQQAELERQRREEAERQAELERQRREEAERQAELERQREEEAERQRRAAEEARQRAEREAELAEQLAAEAERRQARDAGLLDQYRRDLQNVIQQNWIRPNSAQPGIECVVNVTQIPSGDVVGVRIGRCNGDDAVVRSIEQAVLRASPLPRPPVPALFERNLDVIFSPDD